MTTAAIFGCIVPFILILAGAFVAMGHNGNKGLGLFLIILADISMVVTLIYAS